jgi:putative Holliday junction resolvase
VAEPTGGGEETPRSRDVVLGVDYGTKRVGLALGHAESGLVVALPVLHHPGTEPAVVARLAEVARGRDATVVVLGDPKHLSGKESPQSRTVKRIAAMLEPLIAPVPVVLEDERLTSVDAEAQLNAAGLRWWQYSKGQIDTVSAMTIVRGWLVRKDPRIFMQEEGDAGAPAAPSTERPGARERRDRRKNVRKRRRGDDEAGDAEDEG